MNIAICICYRFQIAIRKQSEDAAVSIFIFRYSHFFNIIFMYGGNIILDCINCLIILSHSKRITN